MLRRKKLVLVAVRLLFALLSPAFALAAANQTPEQTSVEAAALNNQAVAAVEVRHYQEAIELLKQAIALRPDFAMAHYNLGCLYQSQDQFRAVRWRGEEISECSHNLDHYRLGQR